MKKLISLFVSGAVALSALSICADERQLKREDIPLAVTEIEGLSELGIMKGTPQGMEAERHVTRAEALTLVCRVTGIALADVAWNESPFDDIEGHWAHDTVERLYLAGLVEGKGDRRFDPNGIVTGREFVKLLLSAMGYKEVTVENSYEKGVETGLLNDNFTKSVVSESCALLRSDAARLCFAALTAKTLQGEQLYQRLVRQGQLSQEAADRLICECTAIAPSFADRLNAAMPKDENYMFSPLSVKMALAMAANGAEGKTRDELIAACGIQDLDSFNEASKSVIEGYGRADFLRLDIANSIWLNESNTDQSFSEEYKKCISDFYGGEAAVVNSDNAVKAVNGWVNDKTNGKISDIISDSDFISALVNAIYFKGAWENSFSEGATYAAAFTNADAGKTNIDFMHKTAYMSYIEQNGVQIVKLPYACKGSKFSEEGEFLGAEQTDARISMYILLGASNIEAPEAVLNAELQNLKRTYVALSLPKFKTEFSADLRDIMRELGVERAFSGNAQFEKMFDNGSGRIMDMLHKTYISVDENGTEAAAVTGIFVGMTGLREYPAPVEMNVDHPFTYVIRDDANGEILFVGRYCTAN